MPEGSVVQHGHIISVQIEKVSPHGILVRLPDQSTGFIRRRELDGSESLQQPEEVTKIGEQLRALVLHADPQSGLWELSVRRAHAWEQAAKQFRKGSVVQGQVFSVTDDRAYVQILPDVKAMLSISEVPLTKEQTLQDALWIDDRVVGIVTAFHPERTVMTISVSEYLAHTEHVKTKIRDRAQARKQMMDESPVEAVVETEPEPETTDRVWLAPGNLHPIRTVLVIDDAILVAKTFADHLRHMGYQVEIARDRTTGLDKAVSDASVDLAFVDVQLGDSDGVTLAREIAAARPLLPIVMITGEDNLYSSLDVNGVDVVDLVIKPPDWDEVGALLRGVAGGKWVRCNPLLHVGQPSDASKRAAARRLAEQTWQVQVREALQRLVASTGATCALLLEMEPGTEQVKIEGRSEQGVLSPKYDWNQTRFSPVRDVILKQESILELDAKSERGERRFRNLLPLYHFASFIGLPILATQQLARYGLFLFHIQPQQFSEANVAEAQLTARSLALAAERRSLLQTMQTFQQYALVGQLGSSLNHEIRNQLLLLEQCAKNLELVANGLTPQRKLSAEDIKGLQADVKSLSQTNAELRELSDFYRGLTSSAEQVVDVNRLLAELTRRLNRQAKEQRIDIVLEPDSHLPPLRTVRARLRQACLNVMLNAIQQIGQCNHGGGLLVVSTKCGKASDPLPVKIRFDDDGPGIHYQMFERIFEPGVSTRKEGSGLGLFISQSLIESLGGKVRVKDSTLFVGTSFLIEMPGAAGRRSTVMTEQSQKPSVRILIAEDEERLRDGLSRWLHKAHGYQVDAVESGVKALQKVRRAKAGHYSVVLLDQIYDSGPTGLDVLSQIKALWPDLPVILFTGKEPEVGARALQMGAYSYLIKPFANEELAAKINGLLVQDTKLQQVAVTAREILGVPLCLVWVLDGAQGCFKIQAWSGPLDEEYIRKVKLDYYATPVQDFFRAGEPLSLADVTNRKKASQYRYAGLAKQRKWKSLLTAPMLAQGHVIGILDAYTIGEIRDFDERDKQLMHAFATQAATAVHDAQLYRQSQALAEINQLLSGTYGVDTVLDVILDRVLQLVGTDIGWLYLLDHKDDELKIRAYRGLNENEVQKSRKLGDGITGWVAKYGKAQLVPNVEKDKRYISTRRDDIQSEVVVPLKYEDVVMGVLAVKSTHADAFTEEDMVLLSAFASQAALAVERDKLNRHIQRVSQMALTENVDNLVDYVTEAVHDLTGLPVALWLVDDKDSTKAKIRASRKLSPEYVRERAPELAHSITGEVLRTAQMVDVEDLLHDPRVTQRTIKEAQKQGWKSMLVVPLLAGPDKAVGTLSIYRFVERKLTAWEHDLLYIFASQAGMALQSSERLATVQRLNQIGRSLSILQASPQVLRHTLQQIVGTARDELRADIVDLYQYQPDKGEFILPPIMAGDRRVPKIVTTTLRPDDVAVRIAGSEKAIYATAAQSNRILAGKWKVAREARPLERFVIREEIVSSAGVPLKVSEDGQEVLVGVLFVNYRQKHDFETEPGLKDKIETFAGQAAVALRNARLLEREQRLRQQADTLRQVSSEISSNLEPRQVADRILDGLRQVIEYRKASVQLIHGDSRTQIASRPLGDEAPPERLVRPLSEDRLVGHIVTSKQPLILSDLSDPSKIPDWELLPETAYIKSWAGLPLVYGDKTIGLLTLDHDQPGYYTEACQDLLISFGNQAAIALENARLFEAEKQRSKTLAALNETGQFLVMARDLDSVLDGVTERAQAILLADAIVLYQYDKERQDLVVPPTCRGVRHLEFLQGRSPFHKDSVPMRLVRSGETHYAPHSKRDPEFTSPGRPADLPPFVEREGVESSAGVVLKAMGETVGVLFINYRVSHDFDDSEKEKIELFANQAGIAIQNARHHQSLQSQIRDLETLNRVGREISRELEITKLFETLLDLVNETLHCAYSTLFEAEPNGDLVPKVRRGARLQDLAGVRLRAGEGLAGWVALHRQSLIVPDVDREPRFVLLQTTKLGRPHSILLVPLLAPGKVVGVISVDKYEINGFRQEEQRLLETLAAQAAIAIENARLFDSEQTKAQQLEQLHTVMEKMMQTRDLGEVMQSLVNSVNDILGPEASSVINLYDSAKGIFSRRLATSGHAKAFLEKGLPRTEGGASISAIKDGESLFVPDAKSHSLTRSESIGEGIESWACLPLFVEQEALGTLYIRFDKKKHDFSKDEQLVLKLFAHEAAVTVHNARLYEQLAEKNQQLDYLVNRKIRDLRAVYQVSQQLTSAVRLSEQDVLALIHGQTKPLMDTDNMYIALYDETTDTVRFPLMFVDGKPTQVPSRSSGKGRTEWIIQNREPILIETRDESVKWYQRYGQEYIGEPFASWIGVPMMAGDKVLGIIATYHKTKDYVYTKDDQDVLELMASQAAIVLQNARMWEGMQKLSEDLSAGALLDVA